MECKSWPLEVLVLTLGKTNRNGENECQELTNWILHILKRQSETPIREPLRSSYIDSPTKHLIANPDRRQYTSGSQSFTIRSHSPSSA